MADPIRAALERLHQYAVAHPEHDTGAIVAAARAALAAAPGVEPSDELLSIDDLREAWDAQSDAFNSWDQLGVDEIAWWAQRQALARWGRYPAPPAEGEVAELVAALRADAECIEAGHHDLCSNTADQLTHAAALLEQRHPVPVPVSERLPGPEDCITNPRNGQGQWCWGWVKHDPIPYSGRWRMIRRDWLADEAVAWLPAHALPLPSGEVKL